MSQRFSLFYAGYTANAPSLCYELAAFNELLKTTSVNNGGLALISTALMEEKKHECLSLLATAESLADKFEIKYTKLADMLTAYPEWRKAINTGFENTFPMTKIHHFYYVFGRRLAEIIGNTEICITLMAHFSSNPRQAIVITRCSKLLSDNEYLLFKMMAPAALLSGEHGHYHFTVFYKELSSAFKPFMGLSLSGLGAEELETIRQGLEEYKVLAINGLKKSVNLLKELAL